MQCIGNTAYALRGCSMFSKSDGRRSGTYRRLAKLMTELGWTAVRVRGLTRGGYLEQVRGFARCRPVSAGKVAVG
jgi:hypothetical protein